jgi:hypothetical protein
LITTNDNKAILVGLSQFHPARYYSAEFRLSGGPAQEAASAGWQFALNLTDASWFAGLEAFDILGELLLLSCKGESQMYKIAMDVRGTYSSNPLNCSLGDWTLSSSL